MFQVSCSMSILNIFKKKPVKKVAKKEKKPKKAVEPTPKAVPKKIRKKQIGSAVLVLKSPHITEKATALMGKNQYVFKIFPKANKQMIKRAVEQIYDVDVVNVRIVSIPGKQKRLGKTKGWKQGYRKAIVSLKKGDEIEMIPR